MRSSRWFSAGAVLCFGFVVGFAVFHATRPEAPAGSSDLASSREPNQAGRVWTVSGYLPENPNQKVYVVINGGFIQSISPQNPGGFVVETESFIFPGLMDMHNHVKYNVLPLWGLAKGQFLNRFEWRQKFSPYKDAVSFNMKPIKGDTVCAAVRWAEIKSMTGGATSMQGIGGDSKCASGFGVMNVEIPGELTPGKIRALTDLVVPDMVSKVYLPSLRKNVLQAQNVRAEGLPAMDRNMRVAYDKTLLDVMGRSGILNWMESFANQPRSLRLALKLMIDMEGPDAPPQAFQQIEPQIRAHLAQRFQMQDPAKQQKQIDAMKIWLFGKDGKGGYFSLPSPPRPLQGFDLIDDSKTMEYFGKAGVISMDAGIRRYLAMFETATRRSVLRYMDDERNRLAVIAHLSEGGRRDKYNHAEYDFAREAGFARPGLVMIHAVGLDKKQLQDAANRQLSIVWSPFSNLLLYGETLDVVSAKQLGINIALGPDWSPTGSKNMLDELKIARRYLNLIRVPTTVISDKDLSDMATINAARALRLDKVLGRVAPGYMANLLFVSKAALQTTTDPYFALVNAEQEHVSLVTVFGEPLYGDLPIIQTAAKTFGDQLPVETLPRNQEKCSFQKGMRMPMMSKYDMDLQQKGPFNLRSVAAIEGELRGKMGAYAAEVKSSGSNKQGNLAWLDPIFKCEDDYYKNAFDAFIEKSLPQNQKDRKAIRGNYRLDDRWSPLKDALFEGEGESSEPTE